MIQDDGFASISTPLPSSQGYTATHILRAYCYPYPEGLQRAQCEEGRALLLLGHHVQLDEQLRTRIVATLVGPAQRVLPAVCRRRVGAHAAQQLDNLRRV